MSNDIDLMDIIEVQMDSVALGWAELYGDPSDCASLVSFINNKLSNVIQKNPEIVAGTKCKITYDKNGLVTKGEDLTVDDLPTLKAENISDITASAAELNILDGVTITTAELNNLHGLNVTAQDLNKFKEVTAAAGELNILRGAIINTGELNKLRGIQGNVQEQLDAKQGKLGYTPEDVTSKVQDLSNPNNNTYPSTKAVANALDNKQDELTPSQMKAVNSGITKDRLEDLENNKLNKRSPIEAGTKCKITYNADGLVTAGSDLTEDDIPMIKLSKIRGISATANDINAIEGITVRAAELNKLEGLTDNVQTKLNTLSTSVAAKADKTYVQEYVRDHAGFYLAKDNKNTSFNTYDELIHCSVFWHNAEIKIPANNDFAVVQNDENNNNATVLYTFIRDMVYTSEGHWHKTYVVSEKAATLSWGNITGSITNQLDLVAKLNSKQDTLVSGTNIKTLNNHSLLGSGDLHLEGFGTTDYLELSNKPKVNGVTLIGNRSLEDLGIMASSGGTMTDVTEITNVGTITSVDEISDVAVISDVTEINNVGSINNVESVTGVGTIEGDSISLANGSDVAATAFEGVLYKGNTTEENKEIICKEELNTALEDVLYWDEVNG